MQKIFEKIKDKCQEKSGIGRHSFPVRDYRVIAWQPLPEPYRWKSEKV